jgi:hypothetical protein
LDGFMAIIPVLLGGGIPLMPGPASRLSLKLRSHRLYAKTGTLFVEYDVQQKRKATSRRKTGRAS